MDAASAINGVAPVLAEHVANMLLKCHKILSLSSISGKTAECQQYTEEIEWMVTCHCMYNVVQEQIDPADNPQSEIVPTNTKE